MDWREEEALWRYSLVREPADARLSGAERGALVRWLAVRLHAHPSGDLRSVGRTTLDDWIRAYRLARTASAMPGLAELQRLLQAWIEQVYHQRVHSETKMTPVARFASCEPRRPTAEELREAFLWSETRLVTKTATVSLLGNRYEVDEMMCSRRVELRFDPYDLAAIEVHYAGRPCGRAVPHQVGRHVPPHAEAPADRPAPQTGIDYLRLIASEHERDWLSRQINYHELLAAESELTAEARHTADDNDNEDDGGAGALALVRR